MHEKVPSMADNHLPGMSHRKALGIALPVLGAEYPNLVVLSPDVGPSTQAIRFKDFYPRRYFCTGISEQNTLGMASGLAASGWISIVAGYAIFVGGKAWEQIRNTIAYPHLNVKIVATHAGINVGADGVTHQAIEDIALMRAIPGMTVLAPTDGNQVLPVLRAAMNIDGPVYIRLEREPIPTLTVDGAPYAIGESCKLADGKAATVFAIGSMVAAALEASEALRTEGLDVGVTSMVSLKPLDEGAVIRAALQTGAIVTAEDHNQYGGLGSAVAETLAKHAPVPLEQVAVPDTFAESGTAADLRTKYHLTAGDIVLAVKRVVARASSARETEKQK